MTPSSPAAGAIARAGWGPDAVALTSPVPRIDLPVPAYGGRSIANLVPGILPGIGASVGAGSELAPPLQADLDPFAGGRAEGPVVILLVDGLGWFPFSEWALGSGQRRDGPWGRARPITTVFPTTTVAALTSLSTGTAPGRHGVVAPLLYLPRLGGVVDVLRMSRAEGSGVEELVGPQWVPSTVSGVPSVFSRGVPGVTVSRRAYESTGFNRILYEGAEYAGYTTASDMAHLLVGVLGRPRPPPLVFAYWDELDTVQHLRGAGGPQFDFEADRIEHLVGRVAAGLDAARRRATTVLVVADHGLVPVAPALQVRVDQLSDVQRQMGRPFAGDRRAGFFGARPGHAEALRAALERDLPAGHRIVAMDDAVEAGLFGPAPHHPELAERLGDWLVLPPVPRGLTGPKTRPGSRSHDFLASHAGLAPEELLVPLVTGRLSEFAVT